MRLTKIFLLVVVGLFLFSCQSHSEQPTTCRVTKIVDGDTLYCTEGFGKELKVRLIGIDAPESRKNAKAYGDAESTSATLESIIELGKKSTAFVEGRVPVGTEVGLELDVQARDKYGRTLAYVYLPDGTMLNELIVSQGYAQLMTIQPNVRHQELLLKAQKDARPSRRGLWDSAD